MGSWYNNDLSGDQHGLRPRAIDYLGLANVEVFYHYGNTYSCN